MKRILGALALSSAVLGHAAYAGPENNDHYALSSLNAPDPVFVPGGDSVSIRVTATPAAGRPVDRSSTCVVMALMIPPRGASPGAAA